jgi:hypothetical protein
MRLKSLSVIVSFIVAGAGCFWIYDYHQTIAGANQQLENELLELEQQQAILHDPTQAEAFHCLPLFIEKTATPLNRFEMRTLLKTLAEQSNIKTLRFEVLSERTFEQGGLSDENLPLVLVPLKLEVESAHDRDLYQFLSLIKDKMPAFCLVYSLKVSRLEKEQDSQKRIKGMLEIVLVAKKEEWQ